MATAHSLVGCGIRVSRKRLYVMQTVPCCPHEEAEGENFCPKCGLKTGVEVLMPRSGFDMDEGYYLDDLRIIDPTPGDEEGDVYIGYFDELSSDGGRVEPSEMNGENEVTETYLREGAHDCSGLPDEVTRHAAFAFWHIFYWEA